MSSDVAAWLDALPARGLSAEIDDQGRLRLRPMGSWSLDDLGFARLRRDAILGILQHARAREAHAAILDAVSHGRAVNVPDVPTIAPAAKPEQAGDGGAVDVLGAGDEPYVLPSRDPLAFWNPAAAAARDAAEQRREPVETPNDRLHAIAAERGHPWREQVFWRREEESDRSPDAARTWNPYKFDSDD